jgi:hypothetical protein
MNETILPGTYYLGDPSYALIDKYYTGIWGNEYNFMNGAFKINGYDFIVHTTLNGDGHYLDTKNRSYYINSGVIALIDMNIVEIPRNKLKVGHIFKFDKKVNFIYDMGYFFIKSGNKYIKIDTRKLDNDITSDEEEDCLNDDFENINKTIIDNEDDDYIFSDHEENDNNDNSDDEIVMNEEVNNKHVSFNFFKKAV